MIDLRKRFQALDDLHAPDLWREIEGRTVAVPQRSTRALGWVLIIAVLLALALGGAALIGSGVIKLPVPVAGSWTATAPMTKARVVVTATRLLDGTVLVAGGTTLDSAPPAEIYDPPAASWTTTGPMAEEHWGATATLLADGRVLMVGGGDKTQAVAFAQLFDPATRTWSTTGSLALPRTGHTATLLPNGRVLVVGGFYDSPPPLASAELYDPVAGTWSGTGWLTEGRYGHTATLLPDGRVLVAGGRVQLSDGSGDGPISSAELYDPATGTWTATGPMVEARYDHTATLLSNGAVLVAGGCCISDGALATAETYDPASGTWSATSPMLEARSGHVAVPLGDGLLLVVGGHDSYTGDYTPMASADLYDPVRRSWTGAASMHEGRLGLGAALLRDGTVLVAGGVTGTASAAVFDPGGGK
jgi:hypothetical protein